MTEPNPPLIRHATLADLQSLIPLFDAYRQFYRQPSDRDLAHRFLRARLELQESTILLALDPQAASPLGFTQLFLSFSSLSAARIFILNDLFVTPAARRRGLASALLRAAAAFARDAGAVRLTLSTEVTNAAAQALYQAEGWQRQSDFYTYQLPLN